MSLILPSAPIMPFSPAADGWYPVMPLGITHRKRIELDGRLQEISEIFDAAAAQAVLDAYRREQTGPNFAGILVDVEHHSRDPEKRSEAAAWIDDLQIRPDALYAHFRLTDLGDELIRGGRYRKLSPVLALHRIGPGRYRPAALVSVGLTNVADLDTHLPPLSHRTRTGEACLAPHDTHPNPQTEDSPMEAILEALGLAPEATPEDILAAIAALQEAAQSAEHTAADAEKEKEAAEHAVEEAEKKRDEAEHRAQALENAQRERDADAFLAQHRQRIADPKAVRQRYLADPEGTRAIIDAIATPATAPATTLALHRSQARNPRTPETLTAERDTLLSQIAAAHGCTRAQAWNLARNQRPDLF